MKLLMFGTRTGAWNNRGQQLGEELKASFNAFKSQYDIAILVKRINEVDVLEEVRRRNVPIVWDIIDDWPQYSINTPHEYPHRIGNMWNRDQAINWLKNSINYVRPQGIVVNTQIMAQDVSEFNVPVFCLHHHHRPGVAINPIRDKVTTVGYEGGLDHLGKWRNIIEEECAKRGWKFNPETKNLADIDIGIGLREQNGYPPRNWKCNIKLANLHGSGTPCIMSPERSYIETSSGFEKWAENRKDLSLAFDQLESVDVRREIQKHFLLSKITVSDVAAKYTEWLRRFM